MTKNKSAEASEHPLENSPWRTSTDGHAPTGLKASLPRPWAGTIRLLVDGGRARVSTIIAAVPSRLPSGVRRRVADVAEIGGFGLRLAARKADRLAQVFAMPDPSRAAPHPWHERPPPPVSLNRDGVARWAVEHVDDEPSVWSNCAYFVSDALRLGGGLAETDGWRPGVRRSRVRRSRRISRYPAYGCVGDFMIEMQHSGRARLIGADTLHDAIPGAQLGDIVVYNWDGRGHYQHLAVVTAFDDDGRMRVTQQSPSQLNRPWNRFGDGGWIPSAAWLRFATDDHDR